MTVPAVALDNLMEKFSWKTTQENIHWKLQEISKLVQTYTNSRSPEVFADIIRKLDAIKLLLLPLSTTKRCELLGEIAKRDKEVWKQHRWEVVDYRNMQWHENNDPEVHKRIGITSDAVMQIAKQQKDPNKQLIHLVLKIAQIYDLTDDILRPNNKSK